MERVLARALLLASGHLRFSMFYSAKIDKLKAQIRDTDVPLCPNSYEPLFTLCEF